MGKITDEQVETALVAYREAMGIPVIISTTEKRAMHAALTVVDTLSAAEPVAWRDVATDPDISKGNEKLCVVAVRRARSGKVHTFPALFLNAYPLQFEGPCSACPGEGNGCPAEDGDGCPTTGWFTVADGGDWDCTYNCIHLDPGDEHIAWCEFPQFISQPARKVPEASATALAIRDAENERLREALKAAREIVDACAGGNRPAIEWAAKVRKQIDAAPEDADALTAGGRP